MKNALLIFSIFLTIVSCGSDDADGTKFTGRWNWTATCGGITGACGYPDQDHFKTMQITSSKIITVENGSTTTTVSYEILNKTTDGNYTLLEIRTDSGHAFFIRTGEHNLHIEKGDFWERYERP